MSVGEHEGLPLVAKAQTWEEKKAAVLTRLQPDVQFMEKLQVSFSNTGEEGRFWTDLSVTATHIKNPSAYLQAALSQWLRWHRK